MYVYLPNPSPDPFLLSDSESNNRSIRMRKRDLNRLSTSSAQGISSQFHLSLANVLACFGDKHTLGPVSDEVISISFILAPAPLEGTDKALNYLSANVLALKKETYDCFLCGPSSGE